MQTSSLYFFFFFFSSRRRHTRCSRDWSSDVCSSDLSPSSGSSRARHLEQRSEPRRLPAIAPHKPTSANSAGDLVTIITTRSEERRVGKEWRARGGTDRSRERHAWQTYGEEEYTGCGQ